MKIKILNTYIKRPLLWDIIITSLICYLFSLIVSIFDLNIKVDMDLIKSIISDLISTSISLAGFVLASLTIIVTFKNNISHKKETAIKPECKYVEDQKPVVEKNKVIDQDDKQSGIELLFSSKHYGRIVGVFTWAVFIFLLLFLLLSFIKLFISEAPISTALYFCIVPICLTTLTIFRSILVLYRIIRLQLDKK